MNKIIPLLGFGVGFICLGFYWHLYNDVLTLLIFPKYLLTGYTAWGVVYTHDKFFDFMYMAWRLLPWLCVLVGILLLLAAGASSKSDGESASE